MPDIKMTPNADQKPDLIHKGPGLWTRLLDRVSDWPLLGWWVGHARLFAVAYRREKERDKRPRLEREAAEFLPGALAVMERPPAPMGRIMVWVIGGMFALVVTWSILGWIDIHATANGRIVPSGAVKIVQSTEQGVVRAILVKEGDRVVAGQPLLELDPTIAGADLSRLNGELIRALFDQARLLALLDKGEPQWPEGAPILQASQQARLAAQRSEWTAREISLDQQVNEALSAVASVESDIKSVEARLPLIVEREEDLKVLVDKGLFARIEWLKVQEERLDLEGQLLTQRHERRKKMATLSRIRSEQQAWYSEIQARYRDELAEVQNTIAILTEEQIKAADRSRLMTLTAPTDGVVDSIAINTLGGVVTPAQEVIKLVPQGASLEIEARLENKDIGFVELGQQAEAKVEAFNFIKYGTIDATVSRVGADSEIDENTGQFLYSVRATLKRDYVTIGDRKIALSPGMSATLEIKTGRRRIIEFLLAPVMEKTSAALNER